MEHIAKKISEQRHLFGKRSNYTARILANLKAKGKVFTRQQVYNVVSGRYFNMDVAEAFFEELEGEKKRRAELEALAETSPPDPLSGGEGEPDGAPHPPTPYAA